MAVQSHLPSGCYLEAWERAKRPHVRDTLAEGYFCARARERYERMIAILNPAPPDLTLDNIIKQSIVSALAPKPPALPRNPTWPQRFSYWLRLFAFRLDPR